MAINNRDLGTSQQRDTFVVNTGAVATGGTYTLCVVPYPSYIATGGMNIFGISNTPIMNIDVTRYNVAGVTTITGAIGTSQAALAATLPVGFSTTNGYTFSPVVGATVAVPTVPLQTGDILTFHMLGTNANITGGSITLVLQALQDVKTHFGA
jgi:hypothetical protein